MSDEVNRAEHFKIWNIGLAAKHRLLVALLLLVTFLAYIGTLGFQFVYDDGGFIVNNDFVHSWRFVPNYFTEHVWSRVFPGSQGNFYRPLVLLWCLVNYKLFGLNPFWWHLTALATHLVATLMVYFLVSRLVIDKVTAGVAALVFGVHPVHIESVAWLSAVIEPLIALLLFPSFLFYLNARAVNRPPSAEVPTRRPLRARVWLGWSLLLYSLAMLVKETALVLPLIVFAYEWIYSEDNRSPSRLGSRMRGVIFCVAPYLALTAVYLTIRAIVLKGFSHSVNPLPLLTVILTWPSVLWFYIRLLVWPVGLSAFYDLPYVTGIGLTNFALPAAGVIAVAFVLWRVATRSRAARFACIWLLVPILPLMNLSVFPEGEVAHDRYLYLPSVGFAIIVALGLRKLKLGGAKLFDLPAAQVASVLLLAGLLALATAHQNGFWASNLLLYHRGVITAPANSTARNNLANEMFDRGLHEEAINLYQQVLERNPNYWRSNYNLGYSYYRLGMFEDAARYLTRAIQIDDYDPDQFVYLGLTLMKMGRLDQAAAAIRHGIQIRPNAAGYHFALGFVLKKQGNLLAALDEFNAELANSRDQSAARQQIDEIESLLRARAAGDRPIQ